MHNCKGIKLYNLCKITSIINIIGLKTYARKKKYQVKTKFSGITLQNKKLSTEEKTSRKLQKKLTRHNYKFNGKIAADEKIIKDMITAMANDEVLMVVSNQLDAPNLATAFRGRIKNILIATWAITPAGVNALMNITQHDNLIACKMLIDKAHTYKWLFKSTAHKALDSRIAIRFLKNHAKFICIETIEGEYINIIGSMNFTRNPHVELMIIDKTKETYQFFDELINEHGKIE